jgi:hypothetical protein
MPTRLLGRCWVAAAVVLVLAAAAPAKDQEKADCKSNCRITLQSCKQGCQVDRDSGDLQESDLYRQCDQSCHDAYAGCASNCEVMD